MKLMSFFHNGNQIEIHNNWIGKETIKYNGEIMSAKYSFMGKNHKFSVLEDDVWTDYSVEIGFANYGVGVNIYRNHQDIPKWDNKTDYKIQIELQPKFQLPVYVGEVSQAFSVEKVGENEFKLTVWFDFNRENLKLEMQQGLGDFIHQIIGEKPVKSVKITGFTDGIGTDEYNQILSEKRARQVSNFLTKQGLQVDNIAVEGKGKEEADLPDWANRKVEVLVEF